MKFTITTAVLYLLLKLVFYRAAYNPSCSLLKLSGVNPNYRTHTGVPQSDSVNTTSCTHNINHTPHLHSFTVFDIVLGFNLVHFNEYDVCRAVSWHSVSFNESAVSMIISKQTVLHAAHIPVTFSIIKNAPSYESTNSNLVLTYLHLLLIVNAHDIEVNPGPYKPKFPCQVCSLAVKWG